MMNIKTVRERVIVKPLDPETVSSGGIIIPESAAEKPTRGVVVAVGKGSLTRDGVEIEPEVNVGDIVLYSKYNGQVMKLDEGEHLLIKYIDILGVLEE
jgi:chaperonin GroES